MRFLDLFAASTYLSLVLSTFRAAALPNITAFERRTCNPTDNRAIWTCMSHPEAACCKFPSDETIRAVHIGPFPPPDGNGPPGGIGFRHPEEDTYRCQCKRTIDRKVGMDSVCMTFDVNSDDDGDGFFKDKEIGGGASWLRRISDDADLLSNPNEIKQAQEVAIDDRDSGYGSEESEDDGSQASFQAKHERTFILSLGELENLLSIIGIREADRRTLHPRSEL